MNIIPRIIEAICVFLLIYAFVCYFTEENDRYKKADISDCQIVAVNHVINRIEFDCNGVQTFRDFTD